MKHETNQKMNYGETEIRMGITEYERSHAEGRTWEE
jgi:hypothetical protein